VPETKYSSETYPFASTLALSGKSLSRGSTYMTPGPVIGPSIAGIGGVRTGASASTSSPLLPLQAPARIVSAATSPTTHRQAPTCTDHPLLKV
jgi:hypothetical protein